MKPATRLSRVLVPLFLLTGCHGDGGAAVQESQLPTNPSVTVFPVLLGGTPSADVANVVGIMLERGGLQQVELETAAFTPEPGQDLAAEAAAFGAFVAKRDLKTDYGLFAAILGSPRGIEALRSALVDRDGKVVWSEQQEKGSPAFDEAKPGEPLECVLLLAQRLRAPLRLADPMRADASTSKLEQRMNARAGVPPEAELDAMQQRLVALKKAGKPGIRVFAPRIGSDWSADGARTLAAAIEKTGLAHATPALEPLRFTVEASSNEQQMLWSGAHSIQQGVRAAAPQKDYLLFADFLMAPNGKAGAVPLLSPAGEFVVVDYQNSHHEDFQGVAPDSTDACCELVALRLAGYLSD